MKLNEQVDINPRVDLKRGSPYPFVEMADVKPGERYVRASYERVYKGGGAKFEESDTLFARITPCLENGKIAQFRALEAIMGFGSTEFIVFRAIPGVSDPAYIYYLSLTDLVRKPAEKSMSGASGRQRADLNTVRHTIVPDNPLPTQRKIAGILSAYDDLIENNTRRIQILEEMAQRLYREWFVHFRFPGHEQVDLVDSGTEMGRVPEGWEVVQFGDIFKTGSGGTPSRKKTEYYGDGYHWLKTKELNDRFILGTEEQITSLGLKKSSAKLYPPGTVVIAMYGATIGKLGILGTAASTNQACCAVKIESPVYGTAFAYYTLLQNRKRLIGLGQGAAQQNISQIVIKQFPVIKPPEKWVSNFSDLIDPMLNSIRLFQEKNENLRQTRDLLLPRLISGELDVSALDITY